ncbi:hypothetical protein L208DRAFT_1486018 [Tricholoma matsutake]|nr:hypothetical protein L208DRAFT_1486018 [Tricholoma matsutake 945]
MATFEQVSGTFGYSHIGMNLLCINDFALMHKLYQSFLFLYMHGIAKLEAKNPGSLAEGNAESVDVVYHIKEKEGHSMKVTAFFRMADKECKQMNRSKRRHLKLEQCCEDPPMPKLSELTALPKKVPLDWFDPIYWNN